MLKLLRAAHGYVKQLDFAEAVGENQSTVASWEAGKSKPSIIKAKKIAAVLGVSVDEVAACFEKGDRVLGLLSELSVLDVIKTLEPYRQQFSKGERWEE